MGGLCFAKRALCFAICLTALAAPPWRGKKAAAGWTKEEVEAVLNQSPWAQVSAAGFPEQRDDYPQSVYDLPGPAQAGLPAPKNAATDGHWSGGVSRNTGHGVMPSLPVLVRWDSALPVRQALLRAKELGLDGADSHEIAAAHEEPKSYVLTVVGLIPAKQYKPVGSIPQKSTSDNDDGTRPALSTEQVLEGLMANSSLQVRGKAVIRPENVKIDSETGVIHIFFPRTREIQKADKEALFSTRFGSLTLEKRFRLSDMMYQNQLEL
jgi:hypothetical protein